METKNKYFAFISYKREDEEWAVWFHHELENYHLPATLNGRTDLPKEFRPVFRDIDELKAGNLPEQIYNALATSKFLIVICSPDAAKSEWVNKEIMDFIDIGKTKGIDNVRNIFPFIVGGHPHAKNQAEECFPQALLELPGSQERIGGNINEGHHNWDGNVNENGADKAFVKVLAGMLPNVEFDDLWNRYEQDKAKEERLKREERDRFLRVQSRFVAEKVADITYDSSLAQCLAVEVLPKDLENPDRPYTVEAERALRHASSFHKVTLIGHTLSIRSLSFSIDGKRIASISNDFSIRVWDVETGSLIREWEVDFPGSSCVAFAPDNTMLVAAFDDGMIKSWDVETGDPVWSFDIRDLYEIEVNDMIHFNSMDISQDGNRLALSALGGEVFVIDFSIDQTLSVNLNNVRSIAFRPDGKQLVATSDDGLDIFDLETGDRGSIGLKEGVEPEFSYATFSPDGKTVAFVFDDTMGVVEVSEKGHARTIKEGSDRYISVSFDDSGKRVTTVNEKGDLVVWDVQTLKALYKAYNNYEEVNVASFNANGSRVGIASTGSYSISVRNVKPKNSVNTMIGQWESCGSVAYSPDGSQIVTGINSTDNSGLIIWNACTGQLIRKVLGHTDRIFSVSYSADGELLVSSSYDGTVRVWNAKTWDLVRAFNIEDAINEQTAVCSAVLSPDGTKVAASLYNGYIVVWEVNNGRLIHKIKHSSIQVWSIAFSPNGKQIASASLDRFLKLWDVETGKLLQIMKGHSMSVNTCAYSPDGKYIASASDDNTIILWDANTGKRVRSFCGFVNEGSSSLEESKEKTTYKELMNYAGFLGLTQKSVEGIWSLSFSHDGRRIVTTSPNGELVVWDVATGIALITMAISDSMANAVAFAPDGCQIASANNDGTVRIWDFPPLQVLIDKTRERFKDRPLTPEERKRYYLE